MAARIIPIIIRVSGGKDADREAQQVVNAFRKIETEAGTTARGSSNAFAQHFSADFFSGLARQAFSAFYQETKQFVSDSIQLAQDLQNALLGVQSVAAFKGINKQEATEAVNNLSIVKAGLIGVGDASLALKNLLQAGFGLQQSITLIERFGDSAAFGKQAALSYGDAVRSATEGIKNQNSILVDNAGVTKNISVILKERGFAMEDLSDKVKGAAAREALYRGLLAETEAQLGDSAKLTETYTGAIAAQDKAYQDLQRSIGSIIITNPALIESNKIVTEQISATTDEIMRQGSESGNLADSIIDAWAEIKASTLPFLAFMKNAVVAAVAAEANLINASVYIVVKATETLVDTVANAFQKIVNEGINSVNAVSRVARSLPGIPGAAAFSIPELQPLTITKSDFGSAAVKAALDKGHQIFLDSIDKMDKTVDEGIELRRRLAQAKAARDAQRSFRGGFGDLSDAGSLTRAKALADQAAMGSGGGKGTAKEKLSDIQRFDKNAERATLKALFEIAKKAGFIPGTNQSSGAHNVGSFHPLGRALDFSVRGKTPAQVAQFISELKAEGYTVFDERTRPAGQKKWGGPHVHAQFPAGGLLTADPSQAMVFAPWSGKMISQGDYDRQRAAFAAKAQGVAPLQAPEFDPDMVTLPEDLTRQGKLYYDEMGRLKEDATNRMIDFDAEYEASYTNMLTEIKNLDIDLAHLRKQNVDDQFVEQRRLLMAKGEEVDITRQIARVQDEIATGPYNESLRLQLAYYEAIHQVQMQNEADLVRNIQNQVQLAHQMDVDYNRLNDGVVDFLASQKTLQQTFQDGRTNTVRTFFDGIDSAIDRMTVRLGVAGDVLGQFLKDLAHLAASQLLRRLMGLGTQGQSAGTGGSGGILGSIFGGGTPGFAGGPGAGGGAGSGGIGGIIRSLFSGGASAGAGSISVPAAVTAGGLPAALNPSQIAAMTSGLPPLLAGGGAAGSAGLMASLGPALGALAPLLGVGLGASLGGGSMLGGILGGVGGGIAGLGAAGIAGVLPAALVGLAIPGLVFAAPLIIGAVLLAKNAARRRDEKTRDAISNDTGTEIWKLIGEARQLGTSGAMARWDEIASNYATQIAAIKDSNTKRHAQLQWTNDFLPLKKIVEQRAKEGDAAKTFSSNFFPTFAGGGLVPYRGGMQTMIGVRPGERIDDVGLMRSWTVPGRDRGYDSVITHATPGSAVRTKAQQPRFPSFAGGSNAPIGVMGGGNANAPIVVQIPIYFDAGGIVAKGAKSSDGRKAIAGAMHEDAKINGRDGYAGTLEVVLSQRT